MSIIIISNDSFNDKEYLKTFYNGDEYKHFGIGSSSSTLVPMYKEYLSQIIGDRAYNSFKDQALSIQEIEGIQELFKMLLEEKLGKRKSPKVPTTEVEILGKTYLLDLRIKSPEDRIINDFNKIYTIANECLEENKPMYLTIE